MYVALPPSLLVLVDSNHNWDFPLLGTGRKYTRSSRNIPHPLQSRILLHPRRFPGSNRRYVALPPSLLVLVDSNHNRQVPVLVLAWPYRKWVRSETMDTGRYHTRPTTRKEDPLQSRSPLHQRRPPLSNRTYVAFQQVREIVDNNQPPWYRDRYLHNHHSKLETVLPSVQRYTPPRSSCSHRHRSRSQHHGLIATHNNPSPLKVLARGSA